MTKNLIVKDEILIKATPSKVWEVLIKPKYVAQWDELPEGYLQEDMTVGSKVVWENPRGGQTITKIVKADQEKELKIALIITRWEAQPNEGDVAYIYRLEEQKEQTLLKIEIGDFSLIKNGQDYYDASVEFAAEAKTIIKDLAENN